MAVSPGGETLRSWSFRISPCGAAAGPCSSSRASASVSFKEIIWVSHALGQPVGVLLWVRTHRRPYTFSSSCSLQTSRSSIVCRSLGICPVAWRWSYKDFASVTRSPPVRNCRLQSASIGRTPCSSMSVTNLLYRGRSVAMDMELDSAAMLERTTRPERLVPKSITAAGCGPCSTPRFVRKWMCPSWDFPSFSFPRDASKNVTKVSSPLILLA